jgi:hypothetical protein
MPPHCLTDYLNFLSLQMIWLLGCVKFVSAMEYGHALDKVAIYLPKPIFSHLQFYASISSPQEKD